MNDALTLATLAPGSVRLSCPKCARSGRYPRDVLIARFGAEARLPDVLAELAACARRGKYSDPCQARYDWGQTLAPQPPL